MKVYKSAIWYLLMCYFSTKYYHSNVVHCEFEVEVDENSGVLRAEMHLSAEKPSGWAQPQAYQSLHTTKHTRIRRMAWRFLFGKWGRSHAVGTVQNIYNSRSHTFLVSCYVILSFSPLPSFFPRIHQASGLSCLSIHQFPSFLTPLPTIEALSSKNQVPILRSYPTVLAVRVTQWMRFPLGYQPLMARSLKTPQNHKLNQVM